MEVEALPIKQQVHILCWPYGISVHCQQTKTFRIYCQAVVIVFCIWCHNGLQTKMFTSFCYCNAIITTFNKTNKCSSVLITTFVVERSRGKYVDYGIGAKQLHFDW